MNEKKLLVVVVGPTAVGKTSACVELAQALHTEVIYADSRQFFREMQIGTARPLPEEMGDVPHHFVGSHSIEQDYNAGQYEREALALIEQLFRKHDTLILSGGSGMYVQAVLEGMDDMPADEQVRNLLQQQYAEQGLEPLLQELQEADPLYFGQVDRANPHRVMRALEVVRITGQAYSALRTGDKAVRDFSVLRIGLNREREELYARIDLRMDLMLEQGLLQEAMRLLPYKEKNALQTVGYKEVYDFLDGIYDWAEAVRLLKRNSRRYAKRQLTWFRRDPDTHWFHPGQLQEMLALISQTRTVLQNG